jgi:hypothetical protein
MAEVSVEPSRIRTFKHEDRPALLGFRSGESDWVHMDSITLQAPFGLTGVVKQLGPSSAELTVNPDYSGRFEDFSVKIRTTDVLGLFLREQEVRLNLVVESLPRALLAGVSRVAVFPLIVGELPAGRGGGGQELYSVEEYQPSLDTRDILWKRVARATDSAIPVRIREANIKKPVSIGVAITWDSDDERAKRMDLVFEAIAQIGAQFILAHTTLEISLLLGGDIFKATASTLPELADATVGVWRKVGSGTLQTVILNSDLIIAGANEFGGDEAHLLNGTKTSLLVSEMPITSTVRRATSVFTGKEDLSLLAAQVLQR